MSDGGPLVDALDRLERALAEFSEAYEAWLNTGGSEARLRESLARAEERLDEARQALAAIQEQLR